MLLVSLLGGHIEKCAASVLFQQRSLETVLVADRIKMPKYVKTNQRVFDIENECG